MGSHWNPKVCQETIIVVPSSNITFLIYIVNFHDSISLYIKFQPRFVPQRQEWFSWSSLSVVPPRPGPSLRFISERYTVQGKVATIFQLLQTQWHLAEFFQEYLYHKKTPIKNQKNPYTFPTFLKYRPCINKSIYHKYIYIYIHI